MTEQVTPTPGVPEVLPMKQEEKDKALKSYEQAAGEMVAAMAERNFAEREALMEAQLERRAEALRGAATLRELTEGEPVIGHLFQSIARQGHETGGTRGGGAVDAVQGRFEKAVGSRLAKTVNLGTADEGGLLIEGTVLELWLDPLRAASVVLSLGPEVVPVAGDTFKVTGFETDPVITWVEEENAQELTTTPTTGERQTAMRKAMSLMPVTRDYRENASPQILRRLEDLMRNAFRVGFDVRYITGTGLNNTVKGLRNHITATEASAGQDLADVLLDAERALNAIETTNIMAERMGIIWNPRSKNHLMLGAVNADNEPIFRDEIPTGTWLGIPWRTTTTVPTNLGGGSNQSYIIWCAFNQFFIGQGTSLGIEWFRNASYTENGQMVSTIERDTEVLQGRQKTATLMPRPTGGFITTGVVWGT